MNQAVEITLEAAVDEPVSVFFATHEFDLEAYTERAHVAQLRAKNKGRMVKGVDLMRKGE